MHVPYLGDGPQGVDELMNLLLFGVFFPDPFLYTTICMQDWIDLPLVQFSEGDWVFCYYWNINNLVFGWWVEPMSQCRLDLFPNLKVILMRSQPSGGNGPRCCIQCQN